MPPPSDIHLRPVATAELRTPTCARPPLHSLRVGDIFQREDGSWAELRESPMHIQDWLGCRPVGGGHEFRAAGSEIVRPLAAGETLTVTITLAPKEDEDDDE